MFGKYAKIYEYIQKHKKLCKESLKLNERLEKLYEERRKLDEPFFSADFDVELYRDFFDKHIIVLEYRTPSTRAKQTDEYEITAINQEQESGPGPRTFWEAAYIYRCKDRNGVVITEHEGRLSLRRLLRQLLNVGASFRKK